MYKRLKSTIEITITFCLCVKDKLPLFCERGNILMAWDYFVARLGFYDGQRDGLAARFVIFLNSNDYFLKTTCYLYLSPNVLTFKELMNRIKRIDSSYLMSPARQAIGYRDQFLP